MATPIAVNTIIRTSDGLLEAMDAAAAEMEFANSGKEFIICKNASGNPLDLVAITQKTVDGLVVANLTINIATGETRLIGPFPMDIYNDASGLVQLTLDEISTVTIDVYLP